MYDSTQFNGFAKNELDNLLFGDLWNFDIFNESDLHSAAYYYIRTYFQKKGRKHVYVRCEPFMAGKKPDIVIYEDKHPAYVIELKMFPESEKIDEDRIDADLDKLKAFIKKSDTIKWGFFILVYDSDEDYGITDSRLRRWGLEKTSVIAINMQRKEDGGRRRTGYDAWRAEFDFLRKHHGK